MLRRSPLKRSTKPLKRSELARGRPLKRGSKLARKLALSPIAKALRDMSRLQEERLARESSGLKRSSIRRKPRRAREGDDAAHLSWIRTLPCLVGTGCEGRVQAHHLTLGRGLSQKSADADTLPMCDRHHKSLHRYAGFFKDFNREQRADWQRAMLAVVRDLKVLLGIVTDLATEGKTV